MIEFQFANAGMLHGIWVVLVLAVGLSLYERYHQKVVQASFGKKMTPFLISSLSITKKRWKFALKIAVLLLFVLALARPRMGKSHTDVKSEGVEIMFLVDVSWSMLAEDTKPSRLDLAKKEITRFLDIGGGDRVGLIAFAGSSILLSPISKDKSAIKMFINSLTPESVTTQGTDFKRALDEAKAALLRGGIGQNDDRVIVTRVIVVASDGENNEPGALEAAEKLEQEGIRIFALGFGTEKGGPIPIRDDHGRVRGYRKDNKGKVVLSKTRGSILKDMAKQSKGAFYHITYGSQGIKKLKNDIDQLEKTEFASAKVVNFSEKYQWPLFFALMLGFLELFLGERRSSARKWIGRFEVSR